MSLKTHSAPIWKLQQPRKGGASVNWLWLCQLLRHENLKRLWRRSRVDGCCRRCGGGGCTPRDRILSTQTFSSNPSAPNPYYTNVFSQPLWTWFLLHKLFLATALHLILSTNVFLGTPLDLMLSTQTFLHVLCTWFLLHKLCRNPSARDSYYTNFFSQLLCTWFLLRKRFVTTPLHTIFNWLWLCQLLRHENLERLWRRSRVDGCCGGCCGGGGCTPRDRILSTQTFSSNPSAPDPYYTNFFSQPLWTWFLLQTFSRNCSAPDSIYTNFLLELLSTWCYLHKLFLRPLHLILTTQTFSRNSSARDSYYTNFFSQLLWNWFLLHKLFLATVLHLILSTQTVPQIDRWWLLFLLG